MDELFIILNVIIILLHDISLKIYHQLTTIDVQSPQLSSQNEM